MHAREKEPFHEKIKVSICANFVIGQTKWTVRPISICHFSFTYCEGLSRYRNNMYQGYKEPNICACVASPSGDPDTYRSRSRCSNAALLVRVIVDLSLLPLVMDRSISYTFACLMS